MRLQQQAHVFMCVLFFWFVIDIKNGRCVHFYMNVICVLCNKMELNAIFVGLDFFSSSSFLPLLLLLFPSASSWEFHKEHTAMSGFYSSTINLLLVVQRLNYRSQKNALNKHTNLIACTQNNLG